MKNEQKTLYAYKVAMKKTDEYPDWFEEIYSDYDYFKEQVIYDVKNGHNSFDYPKEKFAEKVIKRIEEGIAGLYLIQSQF